LVSFRSVLGATIETFGLDRIDWEILDFGVALHPTYEDANGQRQRLENFFYQMQWTQLGMFTPRLDHHAHTTPWLNISLCVESGSSHL
jgi:hypothetical protein